MNKTLIVITVIIIILIISVVSYLSKYWQIDENNLVKKNVGLWEYCISSEPNKKICQKNEVIPLSLTCIRIFSFLAIILLISSIILILKFPNNKRYYVLCLLISGLFSFKSCLIFISDNNTKPILNEKLGYSWYLELFGSLLTIIIGIILYKTDINTPFYSSVQNTPTENLQSLSTPNVPIPVTTLSSSNMELKPYTDSIDITI